MKTVTIYGCSDDLIEVEGDISEEFGGDNKFLFFDDGSIIHVEYTKLGIWRVKPVLLVAGVSIRSLFEAVDSDSKDYSDKLTIEGAFNSVDCFGHNPPDTEDFIDCLQDFNARDYSSLPSDTQSIILIAAKPFGLFLTNRFTCRFTRRRSTAKAQ